MSIDELIAILQKLKERSPNETVYMSFDNDKEHYVILADVFCDIVMVSDTDTVKKKGRLHEVVVLSHIERTNVGR